MAQCNGCDVALTYIYPTSYLLESYMYVYKNISERENLYLQIKSWSLVEQNMTHMVCNVYLFFFKYNIPLLPLIPMTTVSNTFDRQLLQAAIALRTF